MLSVIKENKVKNTTGAPEPLHTKLSRLWRSCCHREISCWMASVRSYDMLWYNLAKNLPLGVSWDGFSSQQIMPQIKEFVLKLSQVCSYCAANSTSAGLKQLSQMKDEMLQKSILSHQTFLLTGLGFLHRSIRRWSKAAESCIFPAVTSKEVRQIVKSETGETGCTYDLLQSYWSSCTCFQEKNL